MAENDVKMPDLSGVLDMISKNPDLIKNAVNAFSGMTQAASSEISQSPDGSTPASMPQFDPSALNSLLPMLMKDQKPHNSTKGKSNHHDLLCALKPYLSPERCTVIDRLLEFNQLGDLLKTLEGKK